MIGYSIIWVIVGVVIAVIGFSIMGISIMGNPMNFANKAFNLENWISIFTGFILIALGYIIIITGFLASFMKFFGDLIIENQTNQKANTKLNQYKEEFNNFEDNVELKSEYAAKWYNKGIELSGIGQDDEALKAYNKAIEIKPDYANAWFKRSCIFSIKGEKEKALFDLKKAIEFDITIKVDAKDEPDFETLWNDIDFKNLVRY